MAKNVILLGGSNSVMVNGLQKGLREGIEKYNARLEAQENKELSNPNAILEFNSNTQKLEFKKLKPQSSNPKEKLEFYNFALGSTTSFQNLYEIKRPRNQKALENAELIVTESNLNEIGNHNSTYENLSLKLILRNTAWYYEELFALKKKVLILLLPLERENSMLINNIHKFFAIKYGFNLIDMQAYYEQMGLDEFGKRIDEAHQLARIMREWGCNIIGAFDAFKMPKKASFTKSAPSFEICTPGEMNITQGSLERLHPKNSAFDEITYRLSGETKLQFPSQFKGDFLIGLHTWNTGHCQAPSCYESCGGVIIENQKHQVIKDMSHIRLLCEIQSTDFQVDEATFVRFNSENKPNTEYFHAAMSWHKSATRLEYIDIIDFFLAKNDGKFDYSEIDLHALENEVLQIPAEYDFGALVPPVEVYKEIIDEYCAAMDGRKLAPLQNENANLRAENKKLNDENSTLKNELNCLPRQISEQELVNLKLDESVKKLEVKKLKKELGMKLSKLEPRVVLNLNENLRNSAVARVRNHLAYRLGAAIIVCNKSFFGICSLPFVLSFIKAQYKKEQAAYQTLIKQRPELKLPALENYADYKAALKEKECFTYKLGLALMRADKTWLLGGYIKFYFEAKRLEREFKDNKG